MDGTTGRATSTEVGPTQGRLLRALFDQLPAMIAYWDRDACNVVANAPYVEWFGVRPEDMVGRHISEILGAGVYAKNLPFIEGALAGEEQLFDRTLVDSAGQVRHTQASYVPDLVDGQVDGFFVLVTDVTPRVEAQRAMDEAQALAHLGSWSLEVVTGRVLWSAELHRILGVEDDGTAKALDTLSGLVHPEDRDRVMNNIASASRSQTAYSITYRITRPDGEVREVLSRGRSHGDAGGVVTRLSGTIQDITETNRVARDLVRINRELRDANQLNADVIGMLGHDIGSPLTAILGLSEVLDDEWETFTDDERRGLVRRIQAASGRMRGMVASILDLAAVDAGSIRPRTRTLDLEAALRDQLSDVPGGDRVEVRLPSQVPTIEFDRFHLTQIVTNLVTNAFRYGTEPVRLEVRLLPHAVTVTVSDDGQGVTPEAEETLFQRFASTGRTQRLAGGSGFGLYIAAKLAVANGASLTYRAPTPELPHAFVLSVPMTARGPQIPVGTADTGRQRDRAHDVAPLSR